MIVITGATGALMGRAVDHLLKLMPASEIALSVRDLAKAQRFVDTGLRVRAGSYADAAALERSFEGASSVVLVSSNDPTADGVALVQVGIDAAVKAGASHLCYTSHQAAAHGSAFRPAADHIRTEERLAASGLKWTSLRNGFYMQSLRFLLGDGLRTGVIAAPADGLVSWTDRDDEGEAAGIILAKVAQGDRSFDGAVTLTASEAVTFEDIARIASEISGRAIKREIVSDEDWLAAKVAKGTPEHIARFLLGFYVASRQGSFDKVCTAALYVS